MSASVVKTLTVTSVMSQRKCTRVRIQLELAGTQTQENDNLSDNFKARGIS
jgi:hypothetical protein